MGKGFVNVSGGGGSEEKLTAHLEDKNNPHGVSAGQIGAMARGGYGYYSGNIDDLKTAGCYLCVNVSGGVVPTGSEWFTMFVIAGGTGSFIQIASGAVSAGLWVRHHDGNAWSAWKRMAATDDLASYLPLSGGTMTGALCVGKHARLSEAAGDSWGTFTLDSVYGDGFARLALICYGAGSDPGAIIQLFKENGEYVKGMALLHEGNIGSQTVNKAKYASITDPGTASLKNIKAGTSDLTAGSSALTTGDIYLVYE